MAKTKISEFSATPGNNTDIDGINIAEGCAPSGINDAIRELMAQLKDFQAGTAGDSFNGPVGTTTPAAGAFTTLTTSGAVTHNGGTANGVAYLNGSKVLTTGSALTFNGTTLSIGNASVANGKAFFQNATNDAYGVIGTIGGADFRIESTYGSTAGYKPITFYTNGSEQMRMTSTGLGIGTSSPGAKLDVVGNIRAAQTGATALVIANVNTPGTSYSSQFQLQIDGTYYGIVGAAGYAGLLTSGSAAGDMVLRTNSRKILFTTNDGTTTSLALDTSGNLGLGVSPSAWGGGYKGFQVGQGGFMSRTGGSDVYLLANNYYDGTNFRYINSSFASRYIQDAGTHAWYTAPVGTAGNAISFTQAMTLTAAGHLGLGTTSPNKDGGSAQALTINSPNGARLELATGDAREAQFFASNLISVLTSYNNKPLAFEVNGAERARITSGGDLLVGTTTTILASKFASVAGASQNGGAFQTSASANNYTAIAGARNGNNGNVAEWWYDLSTQVGTISVTSTATAYNTSSDYRLKNITGPITNSGAYIDSLNPVEGTWKADGSTFVGLIAHEVQEASRTNVATGVKDGPEMQGMDYSSAEIIANLIAEVQSLRARVAALEAA